MDGGIYFKVLYIFGVDPRNPLKKFQIIFHTTSVLFLSVLVTLNMYKDGNLEGVEALSTFFHVWVGYGALVLNRHPIVTAVKMATSFQDPISDRKVDFYLSYRRNVEKYYIVHMSVITLVYVTKPFILKGSPSIYNCYIPPQIPYNLMYAIEVYVTVLLATSYFGFILLICNLIIVVVEQFRLLNLLIKDIYSDEAVDRYRDDEKYRNEVKRIIEYHLYLIRYIKVLNRILSIPLALLIIGTVVMVCINMYIFSLKTVVAVDKGRAVLTSFAVILEFFFIYGLPAQFLVDEASDIANKIVYHCPWYLSHLLPLRKHLLLIIMRSQKTICIKAGGYHVVNCATILLMLKAAYSFYTFLHTMD